MSELEAERDSLTPANVSFRYTTNFKDDVIGERKLPVGVWRGAKKQVDGPTTLVRLRIYADERIKQLKDAELEGLGRIKRKSRAKAKSKINRRD